MYSQGTQALQSQMTTPRVCTHLPHDGSSSVVYSKVPPIGVTTAGSARNIHTSVGPRQVHLELQGQRQGHLHKGQQVKKESSRNTKGEETTTLACNIMALDRHELDLLTKAVQESDFFVNAGKTSFISHEIAKM